MLRTFLAGIGVLAIIGGAAAAGSAYYYSDDSDAPPRLSVSTRWLDLTTPQGVHMLEQRVASAVDSVCAPDGYYARHDSWEERDCRRDAWVGARRQMDAAIASARERAYDTGRWQAEPEPQLEAGWTRREAVARYGAPIGAAVWQAFQSGEPAPWSEGERSGMVFVSEAREVGVHPCRSISIVHEADGGWESEHDGTVCLSNDGRLHDAADH